MQAGRILVAQDSGRCFLKMTGEIDRSVSPPLGAFTDKLFGQDGPPDGILIDLTEVQHLDSTSLGLLASIAMNMERAQGHKPTIVSTNDHVNVILRRMGFERLFTVVKNLPRCPEDLQQIPGITSTERERAELILEAHRMLMEMNEQNTAVFKDVVAALDDEVRQKWSS